jgi:hypothetical protein
MSDTMDRAARDWLGSNLVTRRSQFASRFATTAAVGALMCIAFGWPALAIWAAHALLVVGEAVLLTPSRMAALLRSASGRSFAIALSTLQSMAYCAYAVPAVLYGGVVGVGFAEMILGGMLMLAVIISQGSQAAFLAAAAPATVYTVLFLPWVLLMRAAPWSQIVIFTLGGALQGVVAVGVWRLHRRLMTAEASAQRWLDRSASERPSWFRT